MIAGVFFMHLRSLSLNQFRCFETLSLALPDGITLFHGNNAQGKNFDSGGGLRIAPDAKSEILEAGGTDSFFGKGIRGWWKTGRWGMP